jgi:hypothetical protein
MVCPVLQANFLRDKKNIAVTQHLSFIRAFLFATLPLWVGVWQTLTINGFQ